MFNSNLPSSLPSSFVNRSFLTKHYLLSRAFLFLQLRVRLPLSTLCSLCDFVPMCIRHTPQTLKLRMDQQSRGGARNDRSVGELVSRWSKLSCGEPLTRRLSLSAVSSL
jgi:hypothetical protein